MTTADLVDGGVEGIDADRVDGVVLVARRGQRAPAVVRAHRRGALEPHLPGDRRRRPSLRPAPPAAQPRPAHRPRHGPRVPGHHRARADGGPRARDLRAVRGPGGQRPALLRHGVRRRPHRPRRRCGRARPRRRGRAGGPASRSPTPWPPCTPSTSTPSGSGTSPSATATSSASSGAGTSSSATRQVDGLDTATIVGAVHDRLAARHPAAGGDVDRPRRLPARQHRARPRRRGARRARLGDLHPRRPPRRRRAAMVYWTEPGDEAALLGVTPDHGAGVPEPGRDAGALRGGVGPRPRSTSTSTSPSATGSWPASSRASTPATSAAPPPETAPASTASAAASCGWRRWRCARLDAS